MIGVSLIDIPTEITDESVKAYLAECSSVVRNKTPRDNDKLFERLAKESFGNKASRVFQYVPCVMDIDYDDELCNVSHLFGFKDDDKYYTTARELLNWGVPWEEILKVVDFTNYEAFRCKAPRFIYNQVQTHDLVTSVSFSARYSDNDMGYWMPPEYVAFKQPRGDYTLEQVQEMWNEKVRSYSPDELKIYMKKHLGINRKEVYNRGADSLEYVVFTLGSFTNSPLHWEHFVNQRYVDSHTQLETRQLVENIKDLIGFGM